MTNNNKTLSKLAKEAKKQKIPHTNKQTKPKKTKPKPQTLRNKQKQWTTTQTKASQSNGKWGGKLTILLILLIMRWGCCNSE